MRAPNLAIFIVSVILAFVGVWEYVGAPLSIPAITFPLVGISSSQIQPFLAANAFWLMCLAWVLLTIATLLPHGAGKKSGADQHVGEPRPAS
jgi:hypothetical protein